MKLWKHVWAHKRNPFYAFCEWYVFGRESNWAEVPVPAEIDLPDVTVRRMWAEGTPVQLAPTVTRRGGSFRCVHLQATGVKAFTCGVCGLLPEDEIPEGRVEWFPRPPRGWKEPEKDRP